MAFDWVVEGLDGDDGSSSGDGVGDGIASSSKDDEGCDLSSVGVSCDEFEERRVETEKEERER